MKRDALNLVAACDESYAIGLCVMVRSVLEHLRAGVTLRLFVLETDLAEATKRRLLQSWQDYSPSVSWIAPDLGAAGERLQRRGYAGVDATYYRLLLGELLPEDVTEVIYLDVDVVVNADLARLREIPYDGHPLLAVPDRYANSTHLPRLQRQGSPWRDRFQKSPDYFNAGVLSIDLERWREERIGERALEIAMQYGDSLLFHDQDALNCVLAGRWEALDLTWNFHELPQSLSRWESRGLAAGSLRELLRAPNVVHFTSSDKPWQAVCFSPFKEMFRTVCRQTRFADGWDPWGSPSSWIDRQLEHHIELNWLVWRGGVHARDRELLGRALKKLLKRPWMIATHPFWIGISWAREQLRRRRDGFA